MQVDFLMQGESAELLAINPEFSHGKFELTNGLCWIPLYLLDGPENPYDTCDIPVLDPPEPPQITCTSELDEETCILAGGQWSEALGRAPYCVCPE
jgi:hypothetical protein